jgi:hypothetical protein
MSEAQFAMVSEWMVNGNINEFVKANPGENRLMFVRISLELLPPLFTLSELKIGSLARRRCQGIDIHSSAGDGPW